MSHVVHICLRLFVMLHVSGAVCACVPAFKIKFVLLTSHMDKMCVCYISYCNGVSIKSCVTMDVPE